MANAKLTLLGDALGLVLSGIATITPSLVTFATKENDMFPLPKEELKELRGIRP